MVEVKRLLGGVPVTGGCGEPPSTVLDVCIDSRLVKPGACFVAVRGIVTDGHLYLRQTAEAGATLAIVEEPDESLSIAQVVVPDTLAALAILASNYYGHPGRSLDLIGITGSNGKTSCTYLMESVLGLAGQPCGVLGTIDYRWPGCRLQAPNTTPLSHDLQSVLRKMADDGVGPVVMEVSSHALSLHRVDGLRFRAAMFTNLSHDHLDFHPSMDEYRMVKSRLFTEFLDGRGGINLDDADGRKIFAEMSPDQRVGYAVDCEADVMARDVHLDRDGTRFRLVSPWGETDIRSSLIGHHNLENLLGTCTLALLLDIAPEQIAQGIAAQGTVPGRLEVIENEVGATVLVDYAHTPDGLENVLKTINNLPHGKIVTVMGCGGDRDTAKRPKMGNIALRLSDWVIVTNDNPRTEDPGKIIDDIEAGMTEAPAGYEVEPDRKEAIHKALQRVQPDDVLLIAGKGHEDYQDINGVKYPFDDREIAREFLRELGGVR